MRLSRDKPHKQQQQQRAQQQQGGEVRRRSEEGKRPRRAPPQQHGAYLEDAAQANHGAKKKTHNREDSSSDAEVRRGAVDTRRKTRDKTQREAGERQGAHSAGSGASMRGPATRARVPVKDEIRREKKWPKLTSRVSVNSLPVLCPWAEEGCNALRQRSALARPQRGLAQVGFLEIRVRPSAPAPVRGGGETSRWRSGGRSLATLWRLQQAQDTCSQHGTSAAAVALRGTSCLSHAVSSFSSLHKRTVRRGLGCL